MKSASTSRRLFTADRPSLVVLTAQWFHAVHGQQSLYRCSRIRFDRTGQRRKHFLAGMGIEGWAQDGRNLEPVGVTGSNTRKNARPGGIVRGERGIRESGTEGPNLRADERWMRPRLPTLLSGVRSSGEGAGTSLHAFVSSVTHRILALDQL